MPGTGAATTSADASETEYGCTTCLVKFNSRDIQREHMRDDWHIYNLKRRIASLPPISVIVFQEQVLHTSDIGGDTEASSPSLNSSVAGEQRYKSRKGWLAHLKSRSGTLESPESISEASIVSAEDLPPNSTSRHSNEECQPADEQETFSSLQCLFCNAESISMESNLTHMSRAHSFFIPDSEFLIDMESLLKYLFAIISVFHECLLCGKLKSNRFGVQDHMRGKGHCRFDVEDDEHQFRQFYDFSEEGEELAEEVILVPEEDELRLPSGKILGHRSRARYFHQYHTQRSSASSSSQQQLLTEADSEAVPPASRDRRVAMRGGTSSSMIGVSELQQRALMAVEKEMLEKETRARNEYQAGVERGGNRQKRFKVKSIGKKQGGLEKRLG